MKRHPLEEALAIARVKVKTAEAFTSTMEMRVRNAEADLRAAVKARGAAEDERDYIEAEIAADRLPEALQEACLRAVSVEDQQALCRRRLMAASKDRWRSGYYWTRLGRDVLRVLRGEVPRWAERVKARETKP